MKAKIEVVETEKALLWGWINPDLIRPAFHWVYRVTSAVNPDNQLTGSCAGTREDVKKKAKNIGDRINNDCKGMHPFARPIKHYLSGKNESTGFNRFPGA